MGSPRRPLGSTYRLQLNGLGFTAARALVGYLDRLGIETLYVSPVLAAEPGSTHGYDVVDPTRLDPDLGTRAELDELLAALADRGMRLLIDIVPNHLATSPANPWWWDTLRLGQASPHARVFDIDWAAHGGRVLLPVLGRPIGEVLANGELSVVVESGTPLVAYFDHRFPVDPATVGTLPADDDGPERLAGLLERQHYRLAHWRLGRRQGNYRRFFDMDTLVGVRVEDPEVYRVTHRLVLELLGDQRVAGVRVDHVDGLADPTEYLARLRLDIDRSRGTGPTSGKPGDAVVLVEKIVARGERLVAAWPVDGTTGYEFAALVGGLWINPSGAADPEFAASAVAAKREVMASLFPGQVARLAEHLVAAVELDGPGSDLDPADAREAIVELTAHLDVYRTYCGREPISEGDRHRLDRAVGPAAGCLDADGRRALELLVGGLLSDPAAWVHPGMAGGWAEVVRRWQQLTGAVAAKGVEDTALYRIDGTLAAAEVGTDPGHPMIDPSTFHAAMVDQARRYPGTLNATSTHDSKRSEDVRARLAVLTEWSGPWSGQMARWQGRHRALVDDVHLPDPHDERLVYQTLVGVWPLDPEDRADLVGRVQAYVVKAAREAKRRTSWLEPDEGYEATLGAFVGWLLESEEAQFVEELESVVAVIGPAGAVNSLSTTALKATAPGVPDFYQGTETWSLALVDPDNRRPVDFGHRSDVLAALDSAGAGGSGAAEWLASWPDGLIKLHVIHRLLQLRRSQPALFDGSGYLPLTPSGTRETHVVAFARKASEAWAVTVVPRLVLTLAGPGRMPVGPSVWDGTAVKLPPGGPSELLNVLTGEVVAVRNGAFAVVEAMGSLPLAVLVGDA